VDVISGLQASNGPLYNGLQHGPNPPRQRSPSVSMNALATVTKSHTQLQPSVGVLALQQLSERPSGGGQSDTNPQAFSACNLMRLRRPVCLSDGRRDCGWRSYGTCWARQRCCIWWAGIGGGESTSLDLPGCPQAIAALDTLQRYLLGVSHGDKAQMSLLSVEQFMIERTMHYATDYALFSCTAIETVDMAKAYLYLYMHIHAFFV